MVKQVQCSHLGELEEDELDWHVKLQGAATKHRLFILGAAFMHNTGSTLHTSAVMVQIHASNSKISSC